MRSMKSVGFALYDCPPLLKAYLTACASGASKELLTQLSADAMAEQEAKLPQAQLIDFQSARREREPRSYPRGHRWSFCRERLGLVTPRSGGAVECESVFVRQLGFETCGAQKL